MSSVVSHKLRWSLITSVMRADKITWLPIAKTLGYSASIGKILDDNVMPTFSSTMSNPIGILSQ